MLHYKVLTLNVSVNAMDRPAGTGDRGGSAGKGGGGSRSELSDIGGSVQGGGMGGGRPDGMSREGGGSGSGDRSGLFERASFKQKFTLSKD